MKFFKVIIPVIISVLIAMSNLTSFYVSAEETSHSNFFYSGYTYDSFFYDMYDYLKTNYPYLSSSDSDDFDNFEQFTGFCFSVSSTSDTFYYFVGIPVGLGSKSLYFSTFDLGDGIYKFDSGAVDFPPGKKIPIHWIKYSVSSGKYTYSGYNNSTLNTNIGRIGYSSLSDFVYDSSQNRVFALKDGVYNIPTIQYTSNGCYDSPVDFTYNCYPIGLGWKNTLEQLTFTVSPDFSESMDLSSLSQNFSINVDNPTNKNYNYMIYISPYAASINLSSSANNMRYCLSSTQWAMQYSWKSSAMSASDVGTSVVDWVLNNYGPNIYNTWGGIVNIGKQFISSQDDGFYYYQLGQCKCPFYLITSKDTKSHVINYSDLGLDLNTDYFLNIIYYDVSNFGIAPTSTKFENLPDPASSAASRYSRYPIFNLSLISNYSVYSSTQFKITNGILNKNDDDIYNYDDVIKNSDPGSASAIISSDDDNVLLNTNSGNSYDSSVKTSYVNYGTIYHGCSISYCGSSSGTIGLPSPDFNYDFEEMIDQTGTFIDLIKTVLSSAGFLPVTLITAAVAVAVYCRILGR